MRRRADGADYLKLQLNGARSTTLGDPNMSEAVARALVARTHANGMKAIAHVETLADVEVALVAGVDGLAHVWRRGGANAEIARRIKDRGVLPAGARISSWSGEIRSTTSPRRATSCGSGGRASPLGDDD
jgi:imidazolonepropionase-like amidohydrolase